MSDIRKLSAPHCVLLAVQYATEPSIDSLRTLTRRRQDALQPSLILQILLTYLPESINPEEYATYLSELIIGLEELDDEPTATLDTSPVDHLTDSQARKKAHKLHLLPLAHALFQNEPELDPLTLFLIHRAYRVDAETGLLELVPQLVVPFLEHSEFLRIWFVSTVLPLLRLGYEYYPQSTVPSLEAFTQYKGMRAVDFQLGNLQQSRGSGFDMRNAARDIRGVLGPWLCGANERKRRKLNVAQRRASVDQQPLEQDDWECLFEWLANRSMRDFPLVSSTIEEWDGPGDIDFGGFDDGHVFVDEEHQRQLEVRYAQTAFASLYMVKDSSLETIKSAHALLTRLAALLDFDSPPDLNISPESLPAYDIPTPLFAESTTTPLQDEQLLRADNVLTKPGAHTFRLLELLFFSTCLLSSMQHSISVRDLAQIYMRGDRSEQLSLLQKLLHSLSSGAKKDAEQWKLIRVKLIWLWNWGTAGTQDGVSFGHGIFGKLDITTVETNILKALIESGHFPLAVQTYLKSPSKTPPLPALEVEKIVLASAMYHYENASNSNRTRGGMKRASDIIAAFSPSFRSSTRFRRTQALLSATHAMSFYSLILQHGVPFQPVNIRVSADPLSLVRKLLSQNSGSYTHLDDLISIGQNLVISQPATLMDEGQEPAALFTADGIEKQKASAERRVIGMAIEAALNEDDFETAYSYVVNRLTPPSASTSTSPAASVSSKRFSFDSSSSSEVDEAEDISWRAALLAGRHGGSPLSSSMTSGGTTANPVQRRLDQRMELLSQALLLAPASHLEEVLAVWQQCESEMTTLLAQEAKVDEQFNDFADRRLPGAFTNDTVAVQPRREVGRGAAEEAPMGLFDVARGAAAAFSKSAFPLRGSNTGASGKHVIEAEEPSGRMSMDSTSEVGSIGMDDGRVRRRDMVANAVTGGLASGLGWVLGAKPVHDQEQQ